METFGRKNHWEKIYNTKQLTEVSWCQPYPETLLDLIRIVYYPLNAIGFTVEICLHCLNYRNKIKCFLDFA